MRSAYRFHVYFHVRSILHDLGTPLPHEDGFSKVKKVSVNSAYYSICNENDVDANETSMYGDWFYTTSYGIFCHEVKVDALSKVDFSVGMGIYMLPSNLNLNIGKTKGYSNKMLVSNTDNKIGSNRDINKYHKKLPPDIPKIVIPVA